jgi:hypothetical protein
MIVRMIPAPVIVEHLVVICCDGTLRTFKELVVASLNGYGVVPGRKFEVDKSRMKISSMCTKLFPLAYRAYTSHLDDRRQMRLVLLVDTEERSKPRTERCDQSEKFY